MVTKSTLSLNLPADKRYIPLAVSAAGEYAESLGFDEDALRIKLATEEVMHHALEFGFGGEEDSIQVSMAPTALGVSVQTSFHGLPLKTDELPRYDSKRALEYDDATGISLLLIENMMDKSSFSVLPGGIRMVSMEKYLPAELGKKQSSRQRMPARSGQTPYDIRISVPDDAESISRLAFLSHAAVLFSEHIYYPRHVRNMLQSGEMVSIAAQITGSDQLVGHLALIKHNLNARVEELTFAIVDPRYRCKDCGRKMVQFIEEKAKARGVYAIIVFNVTNHPHSQRAVHKDGYIECSLFVDASPAAHSWGKSESCETRIGNMTFSKYLGVFSAKAFYVPDHHLDMIEKLYSKHDVPIQFVREDGVLLSENETEIWTLSDVKEGWTIVGINRYGADALARVVECLNRSLAQGIVSTQLFLPLDDPMTRTMTAQFEALGFFFAGVGPAEDGREGLQLQYVATEQTDYDSIHAFSEFARELKEYVRKHDPRIKGEEPRLYPANVG